MDQRTTTNILLAIIVGILLFGQDTVLNSLRASGPIVGILLALGVIGLVVFLFFASMIDSIRDAETVGEKALVVVGYFGGALLIPFALQVAWFWWDGHPQPIEATIDTPIGVFWKYIVMIAIIAWCLFVLAAILWRFYSKPGTFTNVVMWLVGAAFGPIVYPIINWRERTTEGQSIGVLIASSLYVSFLGLFMAGIVWGISFAIIYNLGGYFGWWAY